MLRKSNDIIEDAFKKKMLEGNIPPPPNAWSKLEANLGGVSSPVNYWKWWAIAATILLFIGNGAIYYTLNNKIGDLEDVVEHQEHYVQHLAYFQNKGKTKQNQWKEIIFAQNGQIASLQNRVKDLIGKSQKTNTSNDNFLRNLQQQYMNNIAEMNQQNQQLIQQNTLLLNSDQDYKETVLKAIDNQKIKDNNPDTIFIVQKDSVLITQVLDKKELNEKEKEKKSNIKWGVYTGANLIYRNITANQIGETQVTGVRLNHSIKNRIGANGGVRVMYPINKKLEFVGGLGIDILQEKYDLERTLTTKKTIENTNVSNDVYQFDIAAQESKHYETIHNIWTYLDLNAGLNYRLIPDKWNLYFGMGIQRILPMLSNNSENLATYNSSCTFAFEKTYGLNKNHSIGVSPYLTYYLSNAYAENQVLNVKPYMLGLQLNFQRK